MSAPGTRRSACFARSAPASGAPSSPGLPTNSGSWLAGLEVGQAPFSHGLYTLAEVLGVAQPVLLLVLALGRRRDCVGQAAAQRLARGDNRQRRGLRDLGGQF